MKRILVAAIASAVLVGSGSQASARQLFSLSANTLNGPPTPPVVVAVQDEDESVIDLVEDFVTGTGDFAPVGVFFGSRGTLNYLGIRDAVTINVAPGGRTATLTVLGESQPYVFTGANTGDVYDEIEDWFLNDGVDAWSNFLRASNGLSPLALLSGNPKSTVALLGDSPYRKFGFDDSRARFGYGEKKVQRIGGFELRVDASAGSVNTSQFDEDLATIDGALTLAGQFGRHVGLSFSIIGQYRDYNDSKMGDLGLELALPLTFMRPDTSEYFWQLTPFFQAGAGASIDAAAGGLFLGGGVVNAIGRHFDRFDIQMSNEIAYYGGIPLPEIDGYDFDTKLKQWFFKNGVEGTAWLGAGFYADVGLHFTNFAKDKAAVPWYATPTVGVGWQAGRWMDIRVAYEANVDNKDYRGHNAVLKLDFLF